MSMPRDAFSSHGAHAWSVFVTSIVLLVGSQGATMGQAADAKNPQEATPCMDCISIRVGLPKVVQGPGPGIPDSGFNIVRLPNGRFRGFSANVTTYAIDGDSPWDMAGTPMPVLGPAPRGEYGESGEWIGHVERSGNSLLGWVHDETGDRWDTAVTSLQSISMAVSENDGKSWRRLGQIITGTEGVVQGRVTGVGGGDAIDGKDGYYYAYGLWSRPAPLGGLIVARAPVTNPGPGNWKKYFNGSWNEPGLGGNATLLDAGGGTAVARWIATGETVILGSNPGGVGWALYASQDHVHFRLLGVTVLPGAGGTWARPAPNEVIAYPTLLDANTGENQLGDHLILAYTYVQPNEGFGQRYLVVRPVEVSRSRQADEPAGGILLSRWYNPTLHDRWSTTAPVPSVRGTEYEVEAKLGYLLTAPDEKLPSVELEECLSKPGEPLVHVLMQETPQGYVCENHNYTRSRSSGFVFTSARPGTQPLYSCYSEAEKSRFAANSEDCEHAGNKEALLGYVLEAPLHEGRHQIVSQATGLCFNIRGNTNNSGEAIIPYNCGGFINNEFNFVDQGSGFYSIHTVNGTQALCLNISTATSSPGDGKQFGGPGNLIQWSCSGSSVFGNELFNLVDLGGGREQIRVKHSGLCLEDPGTAGTIRQNVCSSSPNQIFTLTN
jgi:hypothetical protein